MTPKTRWVIAGSAASAVGVLVAVGIVVCLGTNAEPTEPDPNSASLVGRGKAVYAQYCASCHGANLEGQPNWRERQPNGRLPAPPHGRVRAHMAPLGQGTVRDDRKRHSRDCAGLPNGHAEIPRYSQRQRYLGCAFIHREQLAAQYPRSPATNEPPLRTARVKPGQPRDRLRWYVRNAARRRQL